MHQFCTCFDIHYLPRGLALYASLKRHCGNFTLWILCFDDATYGVLSQMSLPDAELIRLEDFEQGDRDLALAKSNRSRVEYYFTCTPALPLYVFDHCPSADRVSYLDADLYFFSDPSPLFEEMGGNSILIIPHRFSEHLRRSEQHGIFNVGFLSFRRDDQGIACLEWWRERCIEWCYDRTEDERFADQKYLDQWPRRFSRVTILAHKGAGLAPWNLANYRIVRKGRTVLVDGAPLIFYHFQALKRVGRHLYRSGCEVFAQRLSLTVRAAIYRPYLTAVLAAAREALPYVRRSFRPIGTIRQELTPPAARTRWRLSDAARTSRERLDACAWRQALGSPERRREAARYCREFIASYGSPLRRLLNTYWREISSFLVVIGGRAW